MRLPRDCIALLLLATMSAAGGAWAQDAALRAAPPPSQGDEAALGASALAPEATLGLTAGSGPPTSTVAADRSPADRLPLGGIGGSEIDRAWFGGGPVVRARASQVRRTALEVGAANVSGVARAVVAEGGDELGLAEATLAVRLAPDLPLAHMALARVYWREGQRMNAAKGVFEGLLAIPRHLESSLWLSGSLLLMVSLVMVASGLVFMIWVGISVYSHAAHDFGDVFASQMPMFARGALLGGLVLLPVALGEGALGLVVPFFVIGFAYGTGRHRMALGLSVILLVIGLFPLSRIAGSVLTALDADPVARATVAVLDGTPSGPDTQLLKDRAVEDELARYALAIHARREGRTDEALERFTQLSQEFPRDPVVLANLGNLYFRADDIPTAIGLYEQAAAVEESARLMFNLSQAYARAFRMDDFEFALHRAQSLDPETVVELSRNGDTRLVVDLPLPMAPIRARMLQSADGASLANAFRRSLAPGRLGSRPLVLVSALALPALLVVLLAGRWDHSSVCTRCGRRICARCDDTIWNSEICDGCHHLFHRPEGTDAARRLARLTELRQREAVRARVGVVASIVLPGVAGLVARRPDLSFLGIVFFSLSATFFIWHEGAVPDPLAVGSAGTLAFLVAGVASLVAYAGVVATSIAIRRGL